jgi:hypothetical protein
MIAGKLEGVEETQHHRLRRVCSQALQRDESKARTGLGIGHARRREDCIWQRPRARRSSTWGQIDRACAAPCPLRSQELGIHTLDQRFACRPLLQGRGRGSDVRPDPAEVCRTS